jgi:hypothetical protein
MLSYPLALGVRYHGNRNFLSWGLRRSKASKGEKNLTGLAPECCFIATKATQCIPSLCGGAADQRRRALSVSLIRRTALQT